jgi:membrane fusion protein, heavy metal efflux system
VPQDSSHSRFTPRRAAIPLVVLAVAAGAVSAYYVNGGWHDEVQHHEGKQTRIEFSSQSKVRRYLPTPEQWRMLTVEPVSSRKFRAEHLTEGKISINEDTATPVYSPYPGRVTRLMAKPGDMVMQGQPLFFIEATDMVQAQNDFLAAVANLNKAKSRLELAGIVEKQNKSLFDSRAGSLRDYQQSQSDHSQARSEVTSMEAALEAARNRLAILGKTDGEITAFRDKGKISPETPIFAPIAGTVVQRRVGPGQYVSYTSIGSVDPVFTIGNLDTVWLVAFVRESEAPKVKVGQQLEFKVMAYPDETFQATVDHVSASIDTSTRRLAIRATIDNTAARFKPEMFTSVTVFTDIRPESVAVPRDAVIFETSRARVWVAADDGSIEERQVTTGLVSGMMIEVLSGLKPGERVVTQGGIFVDRAASS